MHFDEFLFVCVHFVRHVWNRRNDIHIEFAIETLLNDFHMQESQKTASEAESECCGRFRLESQRCIVELQLFDGLAQFFVIIGIDRIEAGKDHWLGFLESFNTSCAGVVDLGNGITHPDFSGDFNSGNDIADIAGRKFFLRFKPHSECTDFIGVVLFSGTDELNKVIRFHRTVFNAEIGNDATE